jgi:hypothetical protein
MKHRIAQILPVLAIFLVSLLSLGATIGVALLAHEGTTRVALFATSEAWNRVQATGLPVVRLAMGGMLIIVDGAGAPDALARLRSGSPLLLDASLVPGCETPGTLPAPKVPS